MYRVTSSEIDQIPPISSQWDAFGARSYGNSQLAPADADLTFSQVLRFLLPHIPLMLLFFALPITATFHSLAVLLLGLHYIASDKQPMRATWVIAYITGAEILWRGANAALISEYGKYSSILLCVLVLIKYHLFKKASPWPLLFVVLLVPSIFLAPNFNREAISYQLGGPVALGVISYAFSALEFKRNDLQRLFLALIGPAVSMAFFVAYNTFAQSVNFYGGGANEAVTQGIGANQVTSALSLGALAAFYFIFLVRRDFLLRNLLVGLVIVFTGTSVLTFSRAGLWNFAGALLAGIPFLLRDRRRGFSMVGTVVLLGLLGYFVVFPWINDLSHGEVLVRFSDFDSTGRDVLFRVDYQLFLDNPVFGVGVGQSPYHHISVFGYPKPTHTEYSRLLAEHGSLGVAAIALLLGVTLYRVLSRRLPLSKSISISFSVWALLYMTHAATRMVAPSFAFGLGAARFLTEDEPDEPDEPDA